MDHKVFSQGEVVFREGELGRSFFRIISGTAGVYLNYGEADERKLTVMKPGQFFGEMAVIEAYPRSSTIVAEEELQVTEISEANLNAFFTEQPDQILALMKQLGGRIRELTEEYDEVTAFLKEKGKEETPKKDGFLARLKKYQEVVRSGKRSNPEYTVEENIRTELAATGAFRNVRTYNKGDVVFREGDESGYMYAIYRGTVGIYSNYGTALEKQLTELYPNTFFGEMGMIEHEKRSATAVMTADETDLEIIREEDLEKLFRDNPREVDMILQHLSARLRRLTSDYYRACVAATADA